MVQGLELLAEPDLVFPAEILGRHVDRVEAVVHLWLRELKDAAEVEREPLFDFEHDHLFAQAPLDVAVEHGGDRVQRENLVDGGVGHLHAAFLAGIKVGEGKHRLVGVDRLQELTGLHDGGSRAHHVVEQHDIVALDLFEGPFALFVDLDRHLAFAGALFVEHHKLGFAQVEPLAHLLDEFAGAFVWSAEGESLAVCAIFHDVGVEQVIDVDVVGDDVVELPFEDVGEHLLHRVRVIVHGEHAIDPGQLEHLGVELGGEQLPVEFLEVVLVALEMGLAEIEPRPPILGAVIEIGFYEDHL